MFVWAVLSMGIGIAQCAWTSASGVVGPTHIQMLTHAPVPAHIAIEDNQRRLHRTLLPAWLKHCDFRSPPVEHQASFALRLQGTR